MIDMAVVRTMKDIGIAGVCACVRVCARAVVSCSSR